MPEINEDLFLKSDPKLYDLYECAFTDGGDLYIFCEKIRDKLMGIKERELKALTHVVNAKIKARRVTKHIQEKIALQRQINRQKSDDQ